MHIICVIVFYIHDAVVGGLLVNERLTAIGLTSRIRKGFFSCDPYASCSYRLVFDAFLKCKENISNMRTKEKMLLCQRTLR